MQIKIPISATIPSSDYIILGGSGDLSTRKIIPALFWRFLDGQIDETFNVYVCSRGELCLKKLESKIFEQEPKLQKGNEVEWDKFKQIIRLVQINVNSGIGFDKLRDQLLNKMSESRPLIFYLALSSNLFSKTCELLEKVKLNCLQSRLVIEKPLGHDKDSAEKINEDITKYFKESQIYRIDHYLGKESVQNLMALRFANVIFENQWNNKHIANIQITVAETVGLEGRSSYYDNYGAIKDMVQNHLLQLLWNLLQTLILRRLGMKSLEF